MNNSRKALKAHPRLWRVYRKTKTDRWLSVGTFASRDSAVEEAKFWMHWGIETEIVNPMPSEAVIGNG